MKSKKKDKFFEVNCTGSGEKLTLMLPSRLYNDFENCLNTSEGMSILSMLFDEYEALTELQRGAFQTVVVDFCEDIENIKDMAHLLRAMKKVLTKNDW